MKGDFSRVTFDRAQHVSRVLLQQGRVLLDADFNLQSAVSAHGLRRLTRDVVGPHAGPAEQLGFLVSPAKDDAGKPTGGLAFSAGRYYVEGLAAEADAAFDRTLGDLAMGDGTHYLLTLDVWEEHVTWLEDDLIRDPALGGPDTITQARISWTVRAALLDALPSPAPANAAAWQTWWQGWFGINLRRAPRALKLNGRVLPQMIAWTDPQAAADDVPCVADPAGGYRGLENQLYRVEIHAPANAANSVVPTFKWSRENGSVAAAWVGVDGADLLVDGIHDTARGFSAGQWVELTSAVEQHRGQPGTLVRLTKVDGVRLTVDAATPAPARPGDDDHPIVRRWDHREPGKDAKGEGFRDGAIELVENHDYSLEAGIKIAFPGPTAGDSRPIAYSPGDYWLIPARSALGDILWPQIAGKTGKDRFAPREPDGPEHAFAPLALVDVAGTMPAVTRSLQFSIAAPTVPVTP